jgi:hypothetical protein
MNTNSSSLMFARRARGSASGGLRPRPIRFFQLSVKSDRDHGDARGLKGDSPYPKGLMRRWSFILAAPLVLLLASGSDVVGQTISDSAISNAIVTVARHWRQMPAHTPLADGSYPVATNLSQARSAAKPAGIEWDYPRGLNLYGQLRVYDATGDTNTLDFVLTHNLIVARYYAWRMSLTNTLASASQLAKFQTTNAVLGPFFQLGKLDNCGSMTQQLLEGALRHGGGPTIQQLQMAMVTANYISAGQTRLPDGTLYRPADQNAVWADDLYMSCPFLIRWYQYTGDTSYLDDAARQVMNIAGYLQDANGLWFHGYYLTTHSVNGIKWGRGNGWALVSTVEVLVCHADQSPGLDKPAGDSAPSHRRRRIGGGAGRPVATGAG